MAYATESLGLSERKACGLTGISPSVYRYRSRRCDDSVLRSRMRELAGERKRFGSPRLHIMLKREGLVINHKRTERIYSEVGLALGRKRKRKGAARARETVPSSVRPNQRWSMDFVSCSTVTGRRFRALISRALRVALVSLACAVSDAETSRKTTDSRKAVASNAVRARAAARAAEPTTLARQFANVPTGEWRALLPS